MKRRRVEDEVDFEEGNGEDVVVFFFLACAALSEPLDRDPTTTRGEHPVRLERAQAIIRN